MADRETLKGLGLGVAMLAAGGVGLWLGELTARAVFYLTGGLIVIVGSVSGARQLRRSRKRQRERDLDRLLADTGRRLGLSLGRAARPESRSLEGTIDGVRVAVTSQPSRADPTSQVTGVTVTAHHPLLAEVQIRSRWKAPETVEADATPRGAVETGDVLLDGLVEVRGAASLCLALLAHDARAAIAALARRGVVSVAGGRFTYETSERLWKSEELVALVGLVGAAVRAIPIVDDIPDALTLRASGDPNPKVRAQALRALVAEQGEQAATARALERALADESDGVRVVAAGALGDRGVPTLIEIAERTDGDEEATASAIDVLGRRLPTERLIAVLDAALAAKRSLVVGAAVEMLGRPRDPRACQRLCELVPRDDETVAAAAVDALARTSLPEAEGVLAGALETRWPSVRRAAARALGDVGGPSSLASLHALIEGLSADDEIRNVARHSIARIRQRQPDLAPGHVTLAENDGGQLSVAEEGERGRLSSAEE